MRAATYAEATMTPPAAARAFSALGSEARIRVCHLLALAGSHGLTPTSMSATLRMDGGTLGHHLKKLRGASLVQDRREGKSVLYSLNTNAVDGLSKYLAGDAEQGRMGAPRRDRRE